MRLTLGFDLATKTGFALHDGKSVVESRVLNFARKKHKTYGDMWRSVYAEFLPLLEIGYQEIRPVAVYEDVMRHSSVDAAHLYGGFKTILQMACSEAEVHCVGVPVGTIKKFATGKGNATKEEMIAACISKLRLRPRDDNEADAIWMAEYGAKHIVLNGSSYEIIR